MEEEFLHMKKQIKKELASAILGITEGDGESIIKNIQPPTSVIAEMAKAAAAVLIAFEHGYRMDSQTEIQVAPGLWICSNCKFVNYGDAQICSQCKHQREL